MEVNVFRSAGMKKVELHALAGSHKDRLACVEPFVANRDEDFLIVIPGTRRRVCARPRQQRPTPGQLKEASAFHRLPLEGGELCKETF